MKEQETEENRSGTQMITRCAILLKLITAENRHGLRLVQLYKAAGFTRPTTHRILQALVTERMIVQDEKSKRYHLGSLIYEMGLAAATSYDLRDLCQPFLKQVAAETGDTVFLTIRSGFDGVCAARAEGAYPVKAFVLDVGRHRPLNIGGGAVALLSGLQDDEIERIYRANEERLTRDYSGFDVDLMWERIEQVRTKGYFVNQVLEAPEIHALAVPIFGQHGAPVGALSISALKKRLSRSFLNERVAVLRKVVQEIEAELMG